MTETALDKTFDPASIEKKWYEHWETNGLFRPERPDAQPFTIVNPPPNVTGSLHIGHALDNTLQDVVIRHERLKGKDALWVVGTDHAGIATQMVVERQLEAAGDKRSNYSREAFVEKVWDWKAESGGTITRQLRRLGCSMAWDVGSPGPDAEGKHHGQFTMDPHFSRAVVKVFVDLYNTILPDGTRMIYRYKRLVNWDPKLKTAISDLEVETREIKGHFWHFRYPLADGVKTSDGKGYIVVATTRPETMLADMAVAVNEKDERYRSLIEAGAKVILPITNRRIPIITDDHADPELGSGAVKITPGHDFNDFEVGERAGFKPADMLNMFDAEARVCQTSDNKIPSEWLGLDRFVVRDAVVGRIATAKLLDGVEDRVIQTPYGDRSGVVIEPWLTDQWYVNAAELAKAPIKAVRDETIEIVPKSWEKTWFNWMENIKPWCVSRQLWWGHRIPAWYAPKVISSGGKTTYLSGFNIDGQNPPVMTNPNLVVAESYDAALAGLKELYPANVGFVRCDSWEDWRRLILNGIAAGQHPGVDGNPVPVVQDNDVLDTWFSSALWPFATLGWPEEGAPLVQRHYPNDLLISGFDILFFWCARMAMQGMHFMDEVPWKRLYLHGLVRAADGQKMSKSKGNVVDPLGLIDSYGADALRFFMCAMESQGRDVKMDERRVEGYRNFATKLWNAARFCQANGITASQSLAAPQATSAVNKWIIGEVVETLAELDKAMADLRFDAAANAIYHFVWDQFCDWYIELIKGSFDAETRLVAGWVLDQILVMLHPFMPFVTEELWSKLGERARPDKQPWPLITAQWPQPGAGVDAAAKAEVDWLIALIGNLRTAKNELGIPPGAKLDAYLPEPSPATAGIIARNPGAIERLARLNGIRFESAPDGAAMQIGAGDANLIVPLEGIIDIAAEKARLAKALEASTKEARSLEGRLNNPAFVEKAAPQAVDKARADHAQHAAEAERLAAALARLG